MNNQFELNGMPPKPARQFNAGEYKLVCIRESFSERDALDCSTPDEAAKYFRAEIVNSHRYDPDKESFGVILLNTRRRIKCHTIISNGTLDTILVHPREVFRPAIVDNAAAIILFHNHPSGDPAPSEADIKVTRDLIRAGQLLKIEVLDHVIMGQPSANNPKDFASLRELGYFCI